MSGHYYLENCLREKYEDKNYQCIRTVEDQREFLAKQEQVKKVTDEAQSQFMDDIIYKQKKVKVVTENFGKGLFTSVKGHGELWKLGLPEINFAEFESDDDAGDDDAELIQ